jgi:hypothetical protein
MRTITTQEAKNITAGKTYKCSCGYTTTSALKMGWHVGKAVKFWKHKWIQ